MTEEEIDILTSESVRSIIRENLDRDPIRFALSLKKDNPFPPHLVSTQLKYLQKAKAKLPTYYNYLCIIPPLAYQQSSSERTAAMKSYQGKRCLDLSMGLGVDSLHFSHHFEEVISVEMRSDLHLIGKHNFSQLGIQNIRLVHARAEEYLSQYQGPAFDLIYIDPARRDDQDNRIHDLAACSPNIFELWPFLSTHGRKIVVKASPLYDINEGLQKIPNCRKIYIHSAKNEVREVTFEAEGDIESSEVVDLEVVVDNGQKFFRYTFPLKGKENLKSESENITASILLEADVAFYKGRCFSQLMGRYFPAVSGRFTHPMGFFLTEGAQVEDFPGRQFSIKEVFEYKPRLLKRELKKRGMKTIHVIQRNFFQSVANIRQQLSLKEGGRMYLICTEVDGQSKAFLCERLS